VPIQLSGEEIHSLHVTFKDLKQNILYGVDPADIAALAIIILLPIPASPQSTSTENKDQPAFS
jgi:hypothetical protein